MRKVVFSLLAGLALSSAFVLASANPGFVVANASSVPGAARPPGVAAQAWIPLGTEAGFVVTGTAPTSKSTPMPAVNGYLMARRGGKWVRLEAQSGRGEVLPTK
jgi:hypothetical protein